MSELSVVEVQRLEALESVIDAGMQTFVHVGNALLEIRDNRLYRNTHRTFEEYCRERWEFSKSHASRLISAAEVVEVLKMSPRGDIFNTSTTSAALISLEAWLLLNSHRSRQYSSNVRCVFLYRRLSRISSRALPT